MAGKSKQSREGKEKPPSPAAGLTFMIGSLGAFYSLITIVDPLL